MRNEKEKLLKQEKEEKLRREKEEEVRLEQEEQARIEKVEKLKKENDEKVRREKEEQIRREKEELIRREKEKKDEVRRLAVRKADEEARLLVRTEDLNSRRFVVTLPFLRLYIKYSLLIYIRELKRIEIADMRRTRRMNGRGCSVKPLERLGVRAGTQVGISDTDTLYRPFLTPLIYPLLLNNTDMDVDEDADDDEDDDQGEVDSSPSKKGNASYEEQKRRAAQWAAANLRGPSGKKEEAKVRGYPPSCYLASL
jgi:hypothetical protein